MSYLEADADADETIRLVETEGRRAIRARGDVGDERVARTLVEQARDELGRLDVLVNNAAFQQRRDSIADVPTDEWERTLRTNLTGMFFLCREAIPHMEPGASIINTASIQAQNPSASLLAYATTKGGIVTFSKALSAECIGKRHPGQRRRTGPGVDAARRRDVGPREQRDVRPQAPIGRPAQPAELAPAFVYLASPESSYVTGETIAVTGGEFFS